MKKFLLSAAAALAIAAPAAAETTGAVGVTYNSYDTSGSSEYESWELDGYVFHRIAGPWAIQAEGRYEDAEYDGGFESEGDHIALHGLYAADAFTAGVFVGNGTVFDDYDFDFFGAEAVFRHGDWTFEGSGTWEQQDGDYARFHLGTKYFFTQNFAVGARYGFTDREGGDWSSWDVGADYRFSGLPIVLTANYLQFEEDDGSWEVDTWSIGARWEFGSSSLQEADRTAPIADIRNFLNDVRRWD